MGTQPAILQTQQSCTSASFHPHKPKAASRCSFPFLISQNHLAIVHLMAAGSNCQKLSNVMKVISAKVSIQLTG